MYSAPWAKLMMLSRPKITARPEAQHGVERAVDQPQQELAEQGLDRYAEDFHRSPDQSDAAWDRRIEQPPRSLGRHRVLGLPQCHSSIYFLTSGHRDSESGWNA